jgi:hypothetical protein
LIEEFLRIRAAGTDRVMPRTETLIQRNVLLMTAIDTPGLQRAQ